MTNLAEQFERDPGPAGQVKVEGATITVDVTFTDAEIAEILMQVPEGRRVMKEMVALFSENGVAFRVIHDAKREFAARLEEVKVAMTVAQTKAANPTPRDAGLDYEGWIHQQLASIVTLRGDEVEFT